MTREHDRTLRDFNYAHDDITNLIHALTDDLEAANEECQRLKEENESLTNDMVDAEGIIRDSAEESGRLETEVARLKEEAAG